MILFLLSLCFCYSQKNAPSPEDISKATFLKETYPDEDLVVTNSYQEISFGFNSKLKKVTVNTTDKETLLNISSRADIQKECFYSGESQISQFIVRDKKGRKVKNYIKDQGYVSEGLFHNDTRVKFTNISFPLKGCGFTTFVETNYFGIKYFPQLFFSDICPIQHKEVKIVIPNWLKITQGFQQTVNIQYTHANLALSGTTNNIFSPTFSFPLWNSPSTIRYIEPAPTFPLVPKFENHFSLGIDIFKSFQCRAILSSK